MKKIKIKSIKRKIFLFAIIISMILSIVPANALSLNKTTLTLDSGEKITLTKSQLDEVVTITQAEAEEVAMSFVNDMITAGTTDWDEQTIITSVVPMYDNSNTDEITAYTVNLDTGYVVVSAYLDAQSLIPEWSDKAAPLYEELDIDGSDKVIYLGAYEYYADNGTAVVKGLYDEQVQKSELTNLIADTRDLKHIPDIALSVYSEIENTNTRSFVPITDPISHGNANYAGPFYVHTYIDDWSSYMGYYTDYDAYCNGGYEWACSAIAITNAIYAYAKKYPALTPNVPKTSSGYVLIDDIFTDVIELGISENYYSQTTANYDGYIYASYHNYNLYPIVSIDYSITSYDDMYTKLMDEQLVILAIPPKNHNMYGGHAMVCHGMTKLMSSTTGYALTYVHLADGANESGYPNTTRYATLASIINADARGYCIY